MPAEDKQMSVDIFNVCFALLVTLILICFVLFGRPD